nr:ABC transporter ATP-binding protein [Lachnospiraceae bacterium]
MIEIRNMTTEYEYGDPFNISSMVFEKGKITSIIGKNGSGKSTLLKTVAGLKRYKGNILINKKESREYKAIERAREVAY